MIYKIGTRDFLYRARILLDDNKPESLLYAALELRLGIEARLQIYMEVIENLPKKKSKGWKMSDLDKNLENTFKKGNRIVEIMVIDEDTGKPIHAFYYTPVSKNLIKKGERIGDLLHAKKIHMSQTDDWYFKTKQFLEEIYTELEKANKGTLLGPPLYNPTLGKFDLSLEYFDGYNPKEIVDKIGGPGARITMNIAYPDKYP
jgi:hypothetical protein